MTKDLIRRRENEKGFTLIELLIGIAIIGILTAIALPQFEFYKQRSYDADAKSNLHNLFLACKVYWMDNSGNDECSVAIATSYGFTQSTNVSITVLPIWATESSWRGDAQHFNGWYGWYNDSAGNIYLN